MLCLGLLALTGCCGSGSAANAGAPSVAMERSEKDEKLGFAQCHCRGIRRHVMVQISILCSRSSRQMTQVSTSTTLEH